MGAAMSALPLIVHTFEVSDTTLWVICSGVGIPITAALMYNFYQNMRPSLVGESQLTIFWVFQFVTFLVVISNVLNVADVVFHGEPAPIVFGIALSLSIAAYMFSRLLVRPLKRRLREQESEVA